MASNRHNNWLSQEITQWVTDGLVSAEQANQLKARYPATSGMSWGLFLLTAIGAVIFGLGIILFFAYNWNELHKYAKLALIFSALLTSHLLAVYFSSSNGNNRNLTEGFHVLGTMMFGAGIWLIAQIYHVDEHYPTAFALWGSGALMLAWTLPSIIQGLIATVLLLAWGLAELLDFSSLHFPSLIVLVFGVLTLAWVLKSRTLLFASLIASLVICFVNVVQIIDDGNVYFVLFAVALLHICIARLARYSAFPGSADVLRVIGITAYGLLLFIITFEFITERLIESLPEGSLFIISISMMVFSLMCWILLTFHMRKVGIALIKFAELILVLIAIVLMGLLLVGVFNNNVSTGVLLLNALLALHCVLLIIIGTEELNWQLVAIGCITLALLVFWRFNDLFQSLLMRSLVFLVVGAILFFVGYIYAKQSSHSSGHRSTSESNLNASTGDQSHA